MSYIIENPPEDLIKKWGTLAHVKGSEREKILALPFGQFKPTIKALEKDLKALQKATKKKEQDEKWKRRP